MLVNLNLTFHCDSKNRDREKQVILTLNYMLKSRKSLMHALT